MDTESTREIRAWIKQGGVNEGWTQALSEQLAAEARRSKAIYGQPNLPLQREEIKPGPSTYILTADDDGVVNCTSVDARREVDVGSHHRDGCHAWKN